MESTKQIVLSQLNGQADKVVVCGLKVEFESSYEWFLLK